jgi:F-type H+/Na+-transporting ATPase subunit alpha
MQNNEFLNYLENFGEVGYVEGINSSILKISGLPGVKLGEVVIFENEGMGQVISLEKEFVEVLVLKKFPGKVGIRVARTGKELKVKLGDFLLGKTVNGLAEMLVNRKREEGATEGSFEERVIDHGPENINRMIDVKSSFETGVKIVDLIVPLGKGQRQLVIGDRKTGKTQLLLQAILTQARKGSICVYGAIAKKYSDIHMIEKYTEKNNIAKNTVIVASSSSDDPGMVFITPYTAMTVAEYFRDRGYDVTLILDDLTTHAKYYREVSLLAGRFPGRNSYPGDVFYIHSRLMERAGNYEQIVEKDGKKFKRKVSITCLPVAELVMGDISGYVQTNLMAMTDGHIYFDIDIFNQGRRPAINPFLSVTRVGRQAQTPLLRDINRQITSFLVYLEKLREFLHFGAELNESTKRTLALGDRITSFFDQINEEIVSQNLSVLVIASLWAGFWKDQALNIVNKEILGITKKYSENDKFRQEVDNIVASSNSFADIVATIKKNPGLVEEPNI